MLKDLSGLYQWQLILIYVEPYHIPSASINIFHSIEL